MPGGSVPRILRSLTRSSDSERALRRGKQTIALFRTLVTERGEASGARAAAEALAAYQAIGADGVEPFFDLLASEFEPDPAEVGTAASAYRSDPSAAHLLRLQDAVESPRQELFRRLNMAPGGTAALVALRQRMLRSLGAHPDWAGIDADLLHLFRSWFNRGFLVMQRIDWRTSAVVLERLIQHEAVHAITGWNDLRRRLESDRRCYAFFHPALPDEPLIFIEVALTRGLSADVQPLVDPDAPVGDASQAGCAIFYSITNCQDGLRGVSFGNFLIKQVVADLGREFPRLRTFATLSPIPGFTAWLGAAAGRPAGPAAVPPSFPASLPTPIVRLVEQPTLTGIESLATGHRADLLRLCAHYLLHAKRDHWPLDPVARFHLANGARLERVNWLGDRSDVGLRRSLGITANYVYRLADVEHNHEAYARHSRVVASSEIERLARRAAGALSKPGE